MLQRASDYDARRNLIEAAPFAAGGANRAVDLREMLQILRRRRWIVICTTLALLGAALVFVLVVTPLYTATSTVLIDPHRSSLVDNNPNQQMSSNFATDDAVTDSQVLLIQSPVVLGRAVLCAFALPASAPGTSCAEILMTCCPHRAPSHQDWAAASGQRWI